MAKKNYYKILGVSRTASPEEISAAKNRLAKKYHPDANINNPNKAQAEEKFKEIQAAYQQIMKERTQPEKCSRSWKPTAYFPIRRNALLMTAKYSESHLQVLTGTLICSIFIIWKKQRRSPVHHL